MNKRYTNLKRRTRLLVDEALNAVRAGFSDSDNQLRPLELTQLEQRILMSASPVAMVAEPSAVATLEDAAPAIAESTAMETELAENSSAHAAQNANVQQTVELVVIDPSAENYRQLVEDLQNQTDRVFEIVVLNPREDGIAQITNALKAAGEISAVHLVSHGDEGEILLGTSVLSQRNIERYAAELITWQNYLTEDADLLIYGCDLAATQQGVELTESLNVLLGTDIAASDDTTGQATRGGDWDLEQQVGHIETSVAFTAELQNNWQGILAVASTGELPVNTTTTDVQETSGEDRGSQQAVSVAADGSYVVAWSSVNQDGSGWGIYARRFDSNGAAITPEVQVNETTLDNQRWAGVASDGSGNFVVTWTGTSQDGTPQSVYARRFNSNGSAPSGEFRVNTTNSGTQKDSSIAMNSAGDFIIAWQGEGPGDTAGIFYRRFAANQTALDGADVLANATDEGTEEDPDVAINDAGQFAISWHEGNNLYVRHFAADGSPVTADTQVNTNLSNGYGASVGIDANGRTLVTYRADGTVAGIGRGVWGRGFEADGSERLARFQIAGSNATAPSLDMDAAGNFVVVWESSGDGDGKGVYARRYNADGDAQNDAVLVNATTQSGDQEMASVGLLDFNNFVIVWSGQGAGDSDGVFRRQIHVEAPVLKLDTNNSSGASGSDFLANFQHGGGPISIVDSDATITDGNNSTLESLTVRITNRQDGSDEVLAASVSGTNITASYSGFSGTLTLSGTDTVANYQTVLQSLTYDNSRNPATGTSRTITFVANNGMANSNVATTTVSIPAITSDTLVPVADTRISNGSKSSNYGASDSLIVNKGGGGIGNDRSLLRFDVGAVPAGATIISATLELTATDVQNDFDINVYELTEAWDEGTGDDNNDAANWNQRTDALDWTDSGGTFDSTIIDTFTAQNTGTHSWDITSLVAAWADGSKVNNGVILGSTDGGSATVTYDSRQGDTPPRLVVTYALPPNIAPTANAGGPYTISEGDSVTLDGSNSTDPENDTLTYAWDLNYDGVTFSTDYSTSSVNLDWDDLKANGINDSGTFQIALRVNDGTSNSAVAVTTLNITDTPPVLNVTGDSTVVSGAAYTLNLEATDFGSDTISSWTINWGDGTLQTITGNPSTVSHTYTNPGVTNNITFSATDEDGTYTTSSLFVASSQSDQLIKLDGNAGSSDSANSTGLTPIDVVAGPDGLLYVTAYNSQDINRYNATDGSFVDTFVFGGSGGLNQPSKIAFGRDGNLYVASLASDEILRFSGADGRPLGAFVTAGSGGLDAPDGIVFGSNGDLYVSSQADGSIRRFDGQTGAFINTFATFGTSTFSFLRTGPNGNLFASSTSLNVVREFDIATGAVVGDLITAGAGGLSAASGFTWGPNGHVYVADFAVGANRVLEYSSTGTFIKEFSGPASGLNQPTGLTFSPALQVAVTAPPTPQADAYTVNEGGTVAASTTEDWFNSNWRSRQELVLNNSTFTANLTDFAVLVKLHSSAADAVSIDYSRTQDNGEDLRFVDSNGNLLSHETEQWNESGYSYVWVRVPTIVSGATPGNFFMYYDNSSAQDASQSRAVWNNDDVAILHLNGSSVDSSGYRNDGGISDVYVSTGQIGLAGNFTGPDSFITLGSDDTIDDIFAGGGTISTWIRPTGWGENGYGRIADKASTTFPAGVNGDGWAWQVAGSGSNGYLLFEQGFSGSAGEWRTSAGSLNLNTWQHVAIVYDSSSAGNTPQIYIDGILQAVSITQTPTGTARSDAALNLVVGNHSLATTRTFAGQIDEFRVSNVAATGQEIAAQFANGTGSLVSSAATIIDHGGLLFNDVDGDGDNLTTTLVSGPAHAINFVLNADGSFEYVHDGGETTFDSFQYSVSDGVSTSAPVTVNLTVVSVNDAPTVSSIANVSVAEDTVVGPLSFTVSDAETSPGSLIVSATSSNQLLIADSAIVINGTGPNRTISLTPVAGASGGPATITVTVSDGSLTTTTSFDVTITAVNDAPTISAIADVTSSEDTPVGPISFTVGDEETAASALTVSAVSDNQSLVANADIVLAGSGSNRTISLTPQPNASGGPATITVTVTDGSLTSVQTFDVFITPEDDAPSLSTFADVTINEDTATSPISFSIGDVDTPLTGLSVTATSSNTALITDNNITISGSDSNRSLTIVPTTNASGTSTIDVSVSDGTTTVTRSFVVSVTPVDDSPTISNIPDHVSVEDAPSGLISFVIEDAETPASSLVVTASSSDQTLISNSSLVLTGSGSTRSLEFLPVSNSSGSGSITISVSDGVQTTTTTFGVNITPVDDAPIVSILSDVSVDEDTAIGPLSFSISDIDTPMTGLTVSATSSDTSVIANADILISGSGSNRSISLVPVSDAVGTTTISISVFDGTTTTVSAFDVDLNQVNDAPTISSIADRSVNEDTSSGIIPFTINDVDHSSDSLIVTAVSSNQSLISDSDLILRGTGANRGLEFTPTANTSGGPVTITITVFDGVSSTTSNFDVNVLAVNDLPTITSIADVTTTEDTPFGPIQFLISDVETAATGLTVTATSSDQDVLSNDRIVINGSGSNRSISFSPNVNETGTTTITVSVFDGTDTQQTSFQVTVTPVNDAPQISSVADVTIAEDTSSGPISVVVTDVDNPNGSLVLTARSSDQALIADSDIQVTGSGRNRQIRFTPVANAFGGPATITLSVSDGVLTTTTSFDVTATSVNDLPVFASSVRHSYSVADDGTLTVAAPGLLAGVSDAEGDPLSVVLATSPANGTLILDGNGGFTYTPAPGYFGEDAFTFFVTDGSVNSANSTVNLVVPISVPTIVSAANSTSTDASTSQSQSNSSSVVTEVNDSVQDGSGTPYSSVIAPAGSTDSASDEDDDKYVPQGITNSEDDDGVSVQLLFAKIETADSDLVQQTEISISTADSDRVQASNLSIRSSFDNRTNFELSNSVNLNAQQNALLVVSAVDAFAELKGTAQQIDSFKEILEANSGFNKIQAEAVKVGSTSIVIGSVIATVRGGMLALGLLSQLPVWTFFDPLMVMDGVGGDEGDSLQDIVDRQSQEEKTKVDN